jgi:hypothetical protein
MATPPHWPRCCPRCRSTPLILEDLAGLLWFTAKASLGMNLRRLVDEVTLRSATVSSLTN